MAKSTRISKVPNYTSNMPDSVTEMTTTTDTHSYGGGPIGSARGAFQSISGNMIRKVGPHPGNDFGKGPRLMKNDSGHGYHVWRAPGFENDPDD